MEPTLPVVPSVYPAPPSVPLHVPLAAPVGLSGLTSGGDAESLLVNGVLDHQLIMTTRGTLAATFLKAYGLGDIASYIMELRKYHQRPAGLVKALDAVSLKAFMGKMDVMLGNK